jgi:hypothetical protein
VGIFKVKKIRGVFLDNLPKKGATMQVVIDSRVFWVFGIHNVPWPKNKIGVKKVHF